jgi:hypothetical protein
MPEPRSQSQCMEGADTTDASRITTLQHFRGSVGHDDSRPAPSSPGEGRLVDTVAEDCGKCVQTTYQRGGKWELMLRFLQLMAVSPGWVSAI